MLDAHAQHTRLSALFSVSAPRACRAYAKAALHILTRSCAAQKIGGGLSLAYNPALETVGAPMAALTSIGTDRSAGSILPNGLTVIPDGLCLQPEWRCLRCENAAGREPCQAVTACPACTPAVLVVQLRLLADGAAWVCAQVMSNPVLTSFKGLDALQQLGGGLLVVNNTALTSLDGLGALGALNATGAASVSLPKVHSVLPYRVCSASAAPGDWLVGTALACSSTRSHA